MPQRRLVELLHPNLLGLERDEVSNTAWRAGMVACSSMWLWLAFGLVVVAMVKLELPDTPSSMLAGGWLMGTALLGPMNAIYVLLMLRDGWSRRRRVWRAGVTLFAAIVCTLSALLLATFGWMLQYWFSA